MKDVMNSDPLGQLRPQFEDCQRARDLIVARTGLACGEKRNHVLAQALSDGARQSNCVDVQRYLACLEAAPTNSEIWDRLIESLTISETYFFRDAEQMEGLRASILPGLISTHQSGRTLRIWSAGCATGEEPYTLAILLQQLLPDIAQWKILILATDINKPVLRAATLGRYRQWSFRQTDSTLRNIYFIQQGDLAVLRPELRQRVTFAYLNLAEACYPNPANQTNSLDLIVCRNVMIYQPQDVIQAIVQRFYQCLSPGGWLVIGAGESHPEIYERFQPVRIGRTIVFRKAAESLANDGLQPVSSELLRPMLPLSTSIVMPDTLPSVLADTAAIAAAKNANPCETCVQGNAPGRRNRPDEERLRLTACLQRNAHCLYALYQMAQVEANTGRLTEARRWAEQVIERDPLHGKAHYLLALIHEEQGELEQAIARFKKVIYLEPNFALAHFNLGNLYQRIGHLDDAARHRAIAMRMAARMPPEALLQGADDITAGHLLDMARDANAAAHARRTATGDVQ
jgi:chemotaxis protein methyltransferase CheR